MYETICIMNPNLATESIEEKINSWKETISSMNGTLDRLYRWGKKTLAYEVKKFRQGYFVVMHIEGSHEIKDELERLFRISDDVIKYQTIKLNDVQLKISRANCEKIEGITTGPTGDAVETTDIAVETATEEPKAEAETAAKEPAAEAGAAAEEPKAEPKAVEPEAIEKPVEAVEEPTVVGEAQPVVEEAPESEEEKPAEPTE